MVVRVMFPAPPWMIIRGAMFVEEVEVAIFITDNDVAGLETECAASTGSAFSDAEIQGSENIY